MALKAGTVFFDVRPNLEGFEKNLGDSVKGATERVSGRHLEAVSKKFTSVGKKFSLAVTTPLIGLGAVFLNAGSDLNESISKVNVVFDKSAPVIQNWSKTAATSMGISRQEALEAAGTFGNLFRAMQIGVKPAADMSTKIVGLAGDLASFNNANPQEVLDALRSGLVGETEPLRRFGVNINQARLEAEALSLGLAKSNVDMVKLRATQIKASEASRDYAIAVKKHGKDSLEAAKAENVMAAANGAVQKALKGQKVELTAAQKAQAAYSLIMKDTKLAQGDFARTSDGVANKQRIVAAQFKDTAAALGTQLLPIAQKFLGFLSGLFTAFQKIGPVGQRIILVVIGFAAAIGPMLILIGKAIQLFQFFQKAILFVRFAFFALSANPVFLIIGAVVALGVAFVVLWKKSETFRDIVRGVFHVLQRIIGTAVGVIVGYFRLILNIWLSVAGGILHAAAIAFGWIPGIGGKLRSADRAFTNFKNGVLATLEDVSNKAMGWGKAVGNQYAAGINNSYSRVQAAAHGMANIPARYLRTASPAEAGPLSLAGGPEGWGQRFATLFASGVERSLPVVASRTAALARTASLEHLTPRVARRGPVLALAGAGARGGDVYDIDVHNPAPEPASASIHRELRRNRLMKDR
jgi:hypothetical protein